MDMFLKVLADRHPHFDWLGWRIPCDGSSGKLSDALSYSARPKGYDICLTLHGYAGEPYAPGKSSIRKAPVERSLWMEISVEDIKARSRPNMILPKTMYFPGDAEFSALKQIFDKIKERAPVFASRPDSSLLVACEDLKG
jgi:hypothetical protein